jgi:hypothetical protein
MEKPRVQRGFLLKKGSSGCVPLLTAAHQKLQTAMVSSRIPYLLPFILH